MLTKERMLAACNTIISDASQVLEKFKNVSPGSTYRDADESVTDCGICALTKTAALDDIIEGYIDEADLELVSGGYIFPTLHQIGCEREMSMFARFQLAIGHDAYNKAIVPRIELLETIIHETVKAQEEINSGNFKLNDTWLLN